MLAPTKYVHYKFDLRDVLAINAKYMDNIYQDFSIKKANILYIREII